MGVSATVSRIFCPGALLFWLRRGYRMRYNAWTKPTCNPPGLNPSSGLYPCLSFRPCSVRRSEPKMSSTAKQAVPLRLSVGLGKGLTGPQCMGAEGPVGWAGDVQREKAVSQTERGSSPKTAPSYLREPEQKHFTSVSQIPDL